MSRSHADRVALCAPVTDIFRRNQASVLPLINAVSHKAPDGTRIDGKIEMLECSLNIAASDFPRRLEEEGWLDALRTGRFVSFSCDIGPACEVDECGRSPNGFPRYLPRSSAWSREEYFGRARKSVAILRRHFSGVVKVENLNYFPTGAYEMVCEPEFVAELTRELGIELLLDIGHLKISTLNLRTSTDEYLRSLSPAHVSEIHFSGPRLIDGIWEDAHEIPDETDWALLTAILERYRAPKVTLTLEYYRDDVLFVDGYRELWQRFVESGLQAT